MNSIDLINIDYFKKSYYKALLPLPEINDFLKQFAEREVEAVTKTLISLFDVALTTVVIANLDSLKTKQEFLRLVQDDYSSAAIMDFLSQVIPNIEELITQTLERTLLSAKRTIL